MCRRCAIFRTRFGGAAMTECNNPHTPPGREQNPHARLVQRADGVVHFEDSQGHPFEARDLEVTVRVGETADQAQRKLLAATLLAVPDKTRAADVLGVSRRSLYDRLQRLDLPVEERALQKLGAVLGVREAAE